MSGFTTRAARKEAFVKAWNWSNWIEMSNQGLQAVHYCRLHCSISILTLYILLFYHFCSWRQRWLVTFSCGFRGFCVAGTSVCKDIYSGHFTGAGTWCWENDTCLKIPPFMPLKKEHRCFGVFFFFFLVAVFFFQNAFQCVLWVYWKACPEDVQILHFLVCNINVCFCPTSLIQYKDFKISSTAHLSARDNRKIFSWR